MSVSSISMPLKILFCSETKLSRMLGASRPLLDLSDELAQLGWECDFVCPSSLHDGDDPVAAQREYPENLRRHLLNYSHNYNVVDYAHECLPYERSTFCNHALFVARSVLLVQHLGKIAIPHPRTVRSLLGRVVKGRMRRRELEGRIRRADHTIGQADLVNVSNSDDRTELIARGTPAEKIVVLPFGLSRAVFAGLESLSVEPPLRPVIAFIGTFDSRKGAVEFPRIVRGIEAAYPEARFRLLGTAGMLQTAESVLSYFPPSSWSRIEVVPRFAPEELPSLLSDCSLGIFPSHYEGFGLGVLEMLAAGLPVIAYSTPGPRDILSPEYLVPAGDHRAMSDRVNALLKNPNELRIVRRLARQRAAHFNWEAIAKETDRIYREQFALRPGVATEQNRSVPTRPSRNAFERRESGSEPDR